jgi:hypothetical protein
MQEIKGGIGMQDSPKRDAKIKRGYSERGARLEMDAILKRGERVKDLKGERGMHCSRPNWPDNSIRLYLATLEALLTILKFLKEAFNS